MSRNTHALFAHASRNSTRAIVPINDCALEPGAPRPAFYCVHSASGVAGMDFLDLARRLEPTIRFFGIQAPPKRMPDTEFGNSVDSLAEYYADALSQFQPSGPLLIGGYCVGAVIALAMVDILVAQGREVGPLLAIDGVPENTGASISRWTARYWLELARNVRGWLNHGDLMRSRTLRSLVWSIANNASAIGKGAIGLKRGQKLGGGYAIEGIMDVSRYPPDHKSFVNRLFQALFAHKPKSYSGNVVVYEATVKPLLYLPQIGHMWREFARQAEVVEIVGTHISMMHEPYVESLANDMRKRIDAFFSAHG
ncbi:MAG: thioesterase domain-containing protein [Steroidobacteraceae bacterium]